MLGEGFGGVTGVLLVGLWGVVVLEGGGCEGCSGSCCGFRQLGLGWGECWSVCCGFESIQTLASADERP